MTNQNTSIKNILVDQRGIYQVKPFINVADKRSLMEQPFDAP